MTGPYHWFSDHAFSHRGAVAAHSVLPRPFRHHGLQHAKFPCPSLSSWACSNLFPLSWWCRPTISFSVAPFSSCSQSFSVSGSFPKIRLFTSGEQSIGALASKSVFPLNIQGWFLLGLTGLISLLSKRLSRVFSSTTVWKPQFFSAQPFLLSNFHNCMWVTIGKTKALTTWTFVARWCLCFSIHCLSLS